MRNALIKAAGGHRQAVAVLRVLAGGDEIPSGAAITSGWLEHLAGEIEQADEIRDPRVGDAVILRGRIEALVPGLGEAVVRVVGMGTAGHISVGCGVLEHDTAADLYDGGAVPEGSIS